MTFRIRAGIAAAGSAALLLAALGFQYLAGLPPCHLCILQRWPHLAAVFIGLLAMVTGWRPLALVGAIAAGTSAVIGLYHTGVERGVFEGPTSCTSGAPGSLSSDQLFDQIMTAPIVQCDQIAWQLWGLSMASWNALASLVLVAIWIWAWRAEH